MSHAEKFQTTPYGTQILFSPSDVPTDLEMLVAQGSQVARKSHPDYPKGIWFDNVRVHTIRCALTAQHLELPEKLEHVRAPLIRMIWLHDLPEISGSLLIGFDTSAVVKEDEPDVAARIEKDEDKAARKLFTAADYKLFDEFERGKAILEGKAQNPDPDIGPESYGAKIIDIGDAEMCFYHFLSSWIIDKSYDGRMPTDRPYRFTMNRYSTYLTNIEKLASIVPADLLDVYRGLLYSQITYIISRWERVELLKATLMPEIAKEHVAHLRALLH